MDKLVTPNTYIPDTFIEDVKSYLPAHLTLDDYIKTCQSPLRPAVRVNTQKMTIDQFKKYAEINNWQIEQVPWCDAGFWVSRPDEQQALSIGNTDIHLSGAIYSQEASSMMPVSALTFNQDITDCHVLDMAAAPGSKTSQIANAQSNTGVLVANEYSSSRLKSLSANMQRLGIANVALSHFDASIFGDYMETCFDHILLDAPCSGEGTIRKDPDALKNWSVESNQDIANVQKSLIESAFYALKPGGTLVYSTCTLTPLENQDVCRHLLNTFADCITIEPLDNLFPGAEKIVTDEGYLHVWPQIFDTEGFFVAKFKKQAHVANPNIKTKKGRFPFVAYSKKQTELFFRELDSQFGIRSLPGSLMMRDKELWLFPDCFDALSEKIKYSRIGIQVATIHKNGFRLCHEFATCFAHLAQKNTYQLSISEAMSYFKGQDIKLSINPNSKGEVILMLCETGIGLGKWQQSKIKNNLPRSLIKNNQLITWE